MVEWASGGSHRGGKAGLERTQETLSKLRLSYRLLKQRLQESDFVEWDGKANRTVILVPHVASTLWCSRQMLAPSPNLMCLLKVLPSFSHSWEKVMSCQSQGQCGMMLRKGKQFKALYVWVFRASFHWDLVCLLACLFVFVILQCL